MPTFIVYSEFSLDQPAPQRNDDCIVLRPLGTGPAASFACFDDEMAARAAGKEVYRLLIDVDGPWQDAPSHAVYAIWQVNDPAQIEQFTESRLRLFELRRRVLPHFVYDWLLQSLDQPGRFLVLGMYGDEESATRLCREHPDIQQFARVNPASHFSAEDLTGLRTFTVEQHPD